MRNGGVIRRATTAMLVAGCASLVPSAGAHPNLSEYVQHDVTLVAGATYVDVTVRLTFFGRYAALQRALVDADGDGHASAKERKSFCAEVLHGATQLQLIAEDKALELIPLYAPYVHDAGDEEDGAPHDRFEISLSYFARLPAGGADSMALEVRDGLYPDYAALAAFKVRGKDGVTLTADSNGHGLSRHAGSETPLQLEAALARVQPGAE